MRKHISATFENDRICHCVLIHRTEAIVIQEKSQMNIYDSIPRDMDTT